MRILQVAPHTARRGGPVFAFDLDAALRARGRDIETIALAPGDDEEPLPFPTLGRTQLGPRTLRALRQHIARADVVVAQGSTALPAVAIATIGTGIPFIYRTVGEAAYWAGRGMRRARTSAMLRRAARVVALWDASSAALTTLFGISPDRIRVIPRGVPPTVFTPITDEEREAARRSLGIEAAERVAIYIGSLTFEKRVADAIAAVARCDGMRLIVVGTGPMRGQLEDMANVIAPRRVTFVGSTRRPAPALAAADVLILSSETEGTPGVLLEASLRGLPSVATAVGAVPEIVVDGWTGLLVRVGDIAGQSAALDRTLRDRRTLGAQARAHCLRSFDFNEIVNSWDALLDEVAHTAAVLRSTA